ncbi:MAG: pyrroline-5-carboxylate reductase, partial [Pseudomonadales bacterium]
AVATSKPLVISIAAGIELAALESWLGAQRIVRCMPNTPALVSQGVTAMLANAHVTDVDRVLAESIMGAVGQWLWLEQESQLDAVTALSGSGPAYFFYFLEAMIEAGCELGLSEGDARTLALQTALGSSKMALQSDLAPDALRVQVTSPGGTTERALAVLRNGGFSPLVKAAIKAAEERARELARDFGSQ